MTSNPRRLSSASGSSTAWCSLAVATMWRSAAGRSRQAEDRQVVAFRRPAGENHIPAGTRDNSSDTVTRVFDRGPGAAAQLVRSAAGIAEVLVQVPQHLFGADPRIQRCRRGAIEVDNHR